MKKYIILVLMIISIAACASGQHKYDGLYESPCQVYDDDDFFAGTGISKGSRDRIGEVKNDALMNAQHECHIKAQHIYKGMLSETSVKTKNDIETKITQTGNSIIDIFLDDTQNICTRYSDADADGNVTAYVGIKISKKKFAKKVAEALKDTLTNEEKAKINFRENEYAEQIVIEIAKQNDYEDENDCKNARKRNDIKEWNIYLHKHENGKCAKEAELEIDKLACEKAKSEDTLNAYKKYLDYLPKGLCAQSFTIKIKEKKEDYDICQELSDYNKEVYDYQSPDYKKYNTAIHKWKKYIEYYPDGKCVGDARKQIIALEKKEIERKINDFPADDKTIGRLFTGRFNFGYATMFEGKTRSGFDLGLDFNFNLFQPKGIGGGNLYAGLSLDFAWYFPHESDNNWRRIHLIEIPLMANLGYDFQIDGKYVRFIGAWFAAGGGFHHFSWDWDSGPKNIRYKYRISFAWEVGFDLIFSSGFMITLGAGGFTSDGFRKYIKNDGTHLFMNVGALF